MKATKKYFLITCALAGSAALSGPVYAVDYVFGGQNTNGSFYEVARLNIENISGGGTSWTLQATYDAIAHPIAFINSLDYAYSPPPSPLQMTNVNYYGNDINLFGKGSPQDPYKNGVDFQTAQGTGRFTSPEKLSWNFTGTSASQFTNMSTHINAWVGDESMKFGVVPIPSVPEPETYVMWLAGIAIVFGVCKNKKIKNANQVGFA